MNGFKTRGGVNRVYFGNVCYSQERPSENDFLLYRLFYDEKYALELYKVHVVFTKYKAWSYEGEYKFMALTSSPCDYVINASPTTIYLGCNAKASLLSTITTKASLKRVYKDDKKYALRD
jgi:hypothetical protein